MPEHHVRSCVCICSPSPFRLTRQTLAVFPVRFVESLAWCREVGSVGTWACMIWTSTLLPLCCAAVRSKCCAWHVHCVILVVTSEDGHWEQEESIMFAIRDAKDPQKNRRGINRKNRILRNVIIRLGDVLDFMRTWVAQRGSPNNQKTVDWLLLQHLNLWLALKVSSWPGDSREPWFYNSWQWVLQLDQSCCFAAHAVLESPCKRP